MAKWPTATQNFLGLAKQGRQMVGKKKAKRRGMERQLVAKKRRIHERTRTEEKTRRRRRRRSRKGRRKEE